MTRVTQTDIITGPQSEEHRKVYGDLHVRPALFNREGEVCCNRLRVLSPDGSEHHGPLASFHVTDQTSVCGAQEPTGKAPGQLGGVIKHS